MDTRATFGEFIMGVVSKSVHQWLKENNINDAEYIKTQVSVNTRNLPTSLDDLKHGNQFVSNIFRMPLVEDLPTSIQKTKEAFYKDFPSDGGMKMLMGMNPLSPFPTIIADMIATVLGQGINIAISSLSLSEVPWYICGKKVGKRGEFVHSLGYLTSGIIVITYEKKMRVSMNLNKHLKMDYKQLFEILISNIQNEIKTL